MLFGCARTIPLRRSGSLLRYREFQTVRGTGCLREQEFSGASCPPSVSIFFSSFLLTAAPKRRVRFGNERRNPENRGMARCSGCASLCRFARRKRRTGRVQYAKDRRLWCCFTVTRQQSRTSLQAAARKVKGVDVVTGAGWNRFRHGAALTRDLAQGFNRKEALAIVAMDLGHGDGRGRYVAQVYGQI